MRQLSKKYSLSLITALLLAVFSVSFFSNNASAGREINQRLAYGNAGDYCTTDGQSKGMVWISNDLSDYYSEKVIVSESASSANVEIRGAINICGRPAMSGYDRYSAWAVDTSVTAGPLTITSLTNDFWRGDINWADDYQWSFDHDDASWSHLNATLNVNGVAQCSAINGGIQTGTVTVSINRKFEWRLFSLSGNNVITGDDGTETIQIPIQRNCPENYELTPNMSLNATTLSAGGQVTPQPTVENTGSVYSNNTNWQVTTFILESGEAIPSAGTSLAVQTPEDYFGGSAAGALGNEASAIASGTHDFILGTTSSANYPNFNIGAQTIPDRPVGTKICYALSVKPLSNASSDWRHSQPQCVVIAKYPKVNVLGGDLVVGRGSVGNPGRESDVRTSSNRVSSLLYGSWAEYAIMASGRVVNMASGSGLADGSGVTTGLCDLSLLTFANTDAAGNCNAGQIGYYSDGSAMPNISANFPVNGSTPELSSSVDIVGDNLQGVYRSTSSSLNLTSSADIPAGKWVVIKAPASTVTIDSNIRYTTDVLDSRGDIPQVVIIAKNIIIAEAVMQVDSWLIAEGSGNDGYINTCGYVGELTSGVCNNGLTINGPVAANHLIMRRTAGAGTGVATGEPAEIFNLRADAYLWATMHGQESSKITTVQTTELPPRF